MGLNFIENHSKFMSLSPSLNSRLQALREKGMDHFKINGFPTRRDENWKYTNVKPIQDQTWMPSVLDASNISFSGEERLKRFLSPNFTNIVFINGVLSGKYSQNEELKKNAKVYSLADKEDWIKKDLSFEDTFEALNSAYAEQGLIVEIPNEASLEKPIQFIYFSELGEGLAPAVQPRVIVRVGDRAAVSLIETYAGVSLSYFVNSIFELKVGKSASVSYCRIQADSNLAYHVGKTTISLSENSQLSSLSVSLGARLQRHNFEVVLQGPGADAKIGGIGILSGEQHSDSHTIVDHQAPQCTTEQVYKNILSGSSRSVFDGKIIIRQYSQKANSSQLNHNLLLSSQAEADSKPELKIYADDVKATHGSTTGQLNKEELFYLLSRGIDKDTGIQMLSRGYVYDLIFRIENQNIRDHVDGIVSEVFAGEL